MAKLLKLRRGTTSQHSSFTGAEGEVTVDTDKETLVVHDGSTAGGHPVAAEDMANVSSASIAGRLSNDSIAVSKIAAGTLPSDVKIADANVSGNLTIESADIVDGTIVNADINASAAIAQSKLATGTLPSGIQVNSSNIVDGSIVNADVNASAAIAGSKVSPNFGSQSITAGNATFGSTSLGDTTIESLAPTLNFDDSNSNPDYRIINNSGSFEFQDKTNSYAARLKINTDGHVDVTGNLDAEGGVDVTGNITVSGTVDGRDVAADGTKLDGIATSANNYSHPNHSGEVTSSGDGATTIADNVVDEANLKVSNSPTNGYFLQAQSGNTGGLTWAQVAEPDLTNLSASNLTSGTLPDARFPSTLPAASGVNLTSLTATNLTGALPAISGANLTGLTAANLTGTLPAIDGSNLTGIASAASRCFAATGASNYYIAGNNPPIYRTYMELTLNNCPTNARYIQVVSYSMRSGSSQSNQQMLGSYSGQGVHGFGQTHTGGTGWTSYGPHITASSQQPSSSITFRISGKPGYTQGTYGYMSDGFIFVLECLT